MDLLELTNRLALEAAVSGAPYTTVANATGEQARLVAWVQTAWTEFQLERNNWEWLRSSYLERSATRPTLGFSFTTVTGQAVYPLGIGAGTVGIDEDDFASWVPTSFRNYTTTNGVSDEIFLDWTDYDTWRDAYSYGAQQQVTTRNVAIAIAPDNAICLGPYPISGYTVTGDFMRAPSQMEDDDDVPLYLPAQYHMGIVYKAMRDSYGGYELAPDVIERGRKGYTRILRKLQNLRAGIVTAGRALA